jgi:hypothetical protein
MRRLTCRSWTIGLCAIACALAAISSLWPSSLEVRTEDKNRDGRPDVWRVYNRHGQVATVSLDTNFDGRSDVQEYYDGGALVRRESDRDFNNQIDLVQEFDASTRQSVRSVADVDFDGSADLLVLFDAGGPVYSRWRTGFTPADAGGGELLNAVLTPRRADDRLAALEDPFDRDLVVRPVHLITRPGDYVGTAQAGGLPLGGDDLLGPFASVPLIPDSEIAVPCSAAVIPHSPRGPPARLLS